MNEFRLRTKQDTGDILANLFLSNSESSRNLEPLCLQVREDKCFQENKWLKVGTIVLQPEFTTTSNGRFISSVEQVSQAIRSGFFEWTIPCQDQLIKEISSIFNKSGVKQKQAKQEQTDKKIIAEITKTVVHIAMRCGLAHPAFDALMMECVQSKMPLTVVVDTNAVLQGALDFFARHFTPQSRIKVPALVHMEILNLCERYLSRRRKESYTVKMLLDHLSGLGGQRVLVRLETDQSVEFDRPRLGADPLRGVVTPDSDSEDRNLGLQQIQRSFADRLILETAIQQQGQVSPAHPVLLLTADQGLARMALAESIQPIFFDSNAVSRLFGEKLSGIGFVPFSLDGPRLHGISLVNVLWEFAATFGASRLTNNVGDSAFEVVALGGDIPWKPYHSYEDLLWTRLLNTSNGTASEEAKDGHCQQQNVGSRAVTGARRSERDSDEKHTSSKRKGQYSFRLDAMLRLVRALYESNKLADDAAMAELSVTSASGYREYRNFLVAGDFVQHKDRTLYMKERLDQLYMALRRRDHAQIAALFHGISSVKSFFDKLPIGTPLTQDLSGLSQRSFRTYSNLAEICCLGIRFSDRGIYGTPNSPRPAEFVVVALAAYEEVRAGDSFALTGAWLEKLIIQHGIHPVQARQRLAEAHRGGYIHRFCEGSTPDTRFENRTVQVLNVDEGQPIARTINLYHGDFLMPGRASVSVKLLKGEES